MCALAAVCSLLAPSVSLAAQTAGLKIVVIEGEDAVNVIQQKTAVAPVVEVRDRNDQPVVGAVVRFAIRSGRASFGGARTLTVTTNAAGRAVAAGLTPTGSGALQIGASAAFQGQVATATIVQTNVLTAAQAAGAAGAAGGGGGAGGGISATTLGVVGGAAAGGTLVAAKALGGSELGPGTGVYRGTANYTFVKTAQSTGLLSAPGNVNGVCTWTVAGTADLLADFDTDPQGLTITDGRFELSWVHTQVATSCPTTTNISARSPGPTAPGLAGQAVSNITFNIVDTGSPPGGGTQTMTWRFAGALSGETLAGTLSYSMSASIQGATENVPVTTVPVSLQLVK